MEFNKKDIVGKLVPSDGDNAEYPDDSENEVDDDDEVYMEQNFTDVSTNVQFRLLLQYSSNFRESTCRQCNS